MKPHVEDALEAERKAPRRSYDPLAEDMAFAAGSSVLFILGGMAVPYFGGIAAASSIPVLNRLRLNARTPDDKRTEHVLEAADYERATRRLLPWPGEAEATESWNAWMPWGELGAGAKVPVPGELPHPKTCGFAETRWAAGVGQAKDWVRSMPDGSRLHVHEFPDGSLQVHRDEIDPAQGVPNAALHWLKETREGNFAGVLGAVGLVALAWHLVDTET